jgi:Na+(H+)/acetate symporter ActP
VIVLPIVLPIANWANIIASTFPERSKATAWTRIYYVEFGRLRYVNEGLAHAGDYLADSFFALALFRLAVSFSTTECGVLSTARNALSIRSA